MSDAAPSTRLLRIYLNAGDRHEGRPLHEAIVKKAQALGLAGACVFPAEVGFGRGRRVHDALDEYSATLTPLIVEIIDEATRLDAFCDEALGPILGRVFATLRSVVRVPDLASTGATTMPDEGRAQRVSVYIGGNDTWQGVNLALAIVEHCRKHGFAGATASRGVLGYGRHDRLHKAHLFGLSDDLPEKVEVIDRPERIAELFPTLQQMVGDGLIVVEDVEVVSGRAPTAPPLA